MKSKKTRASRRKYHFIYKTTCIITGKYYIGMHSTDDLQDGYIGSGKRLGYSIKKYGKENHRTEIVELLDSRESLKERERQIVNEEILQDPMCMNLTIGGGGGNGSIFLTTEQLSKGAINANKIKWNDESFKDKMSKMKSDLNKQMHFEGRLKPFNWSGRKHSDATKLKMSNAAKQKTKEKNSQFGTCWIFNNEVKKSVKIKNEELQSYLDLGWSKGRKLKFT